MSSLDSRTKDEQIAVYQQYFDEFKALMATPYGNHTPAQKVRLSELEDWTRVNGDPRPRSYVPDDEPGSCADIIFMGLI